MSIRHRLSMSALATITLFVVAGLLAAPGFAQTTSDGAQTGVCDAPELSSPDGAALFGELASVLLVQEDLPRPQGALAGERLWRPAPPMPMSNQDVAVANARANYAGDPSNFDASPAGYASKLREMCRLLGVQSVYIGQVDLQVGSQAIQFGTPEGASTYLDYIADHMTSADSANANGVTWQPASVALAGDDARAFTSTASMPSAQPTMVATTVVFRLGATIAFVQLASHSADLAGLDRALALARITATRISRSGLGHGPA
jgi:hypothetical protein